MDSFSQQQMSAMMAMAAAGTAPNPGMDITGGAGANAPPSAPLLPGVDPMMMQVYTQMFTQYLQQAQACMFGGDPSGMAGNPAAFPPTAPYSQPPFNPTIQVAVEGMKFQYQLTDEDLQKVFSRYGPVKSIQVEEVGTTAQITFEQMPHAQAAMNDLNGKVLNGLEGTLRIVWANQASPPAPYPAMPPAPNWPWPAAGPGSWPGAPQGASSAALPVPQTSPGALHTAGGDAAGNATGFSVGGDVGGLSLGGGGEPKTPAHVKGVRKYTCRFLIGIENDKEFQVVRRIIGAKGANMKRIVKQTEAKLRLRGAGSGYLEGTGQKESLEPLQLCVSCTTDEGYRTAARLVGELLDRVYAEYRVFCQETGRPELDLHASPQLVSSRRGREANDGGRGGGSFGGVALGEDDASDIDGDGGAEGGGGGSRRGGRRRGRRSRGKNADPSKGSDRTDPPPKAPPVAEIQTMIDQRNEARRQCNFAEADRIRQSLHERGVALMDEPGARGKGSEVTTWRYWRE